MARLVFSRRATRQHRQVLRSLSLRPDDALLEVGPGGGVLLERALRSVASAGAIDHSEDMVEATGKRNAAAVAAGRLELRCGDASNLPWEDETFTALLSTQVFFWLDDPEKALAEAFRVLAPGGRMALMTMADQAAVRLLLRPFLATGGHLYSNEQMEQMLEAAGFAEVHVRARQGLQYVLATKPGTGTGS
jgi:ubiquinone/menaquinone biosynthesis C-methylase UbiE